MNILSRVTRYFSLIGVAIVLLGCGTAPSIKESKLLSANIAKQSEIRFIYREVEMKLVSSSGRGVGPADTGFGGFGHHVAKNAASTFARHGVTVVEAKIVNGNEQLVINNEHFADGSATPSVLVIAPVSGRISSNSHATRASYVFSATLIDAKTGRLAWRATMDTSTWSGQDFVMKNFEKTLYDDAYAVKLLDTVANQMKLNGLI